MEGIPIDPSPVWEALVARAKVSRDERGPGGDDDFPSNSTLIAFMNGLSDDDFDCLLALCYLWEGPTTMAFEMMDVKPEIMN